MADAPNTTVLRRSSRSRKPRETFEQTVYAIDILYTQLRNSDSFEDFVATLFMFYTPACHKPDLWTCRGEHGGVFKMVSRRCKIYDIEPRKLLNYANDYAHGALNVAEFRAWIHTFSWPAAGIREFETTVGIEDDDEDTTDGQDDDDDEDDDGDEDDEDDDEDEEDEDDDEEEEVDEEVDEEDVEDELDEEEEEA
jgi:hypothetical protein